MPSAARWKQITLTQQRIAYLQTDEKKQCPSLLSQANVDKDTFWIQTTMYLEFLKSMRKLDYNFIYTIMSKNTYPIRAFVWKYLSLAFPRLRKTFWFLRVLRYNGREEYLLWKLNKSLDINTLKEELEVIGFHEYAVARIDIGEVLGMRKNDWFEYQYHIRIFDDGEVRGHYEFTPEYAWFRHFFDFYKVEKKEEFMWMIGHLLK